MVFLPENHPNQISGLMLIATEYGVVLIAFFFFFLWSPFSFPRHSPPPGSGSLGQPGTSFLVRFHLFVDPAGLIKNEVDSTPPVAVCCPVCIGDGVDQRRSVSLVFPTTLLTSCLDFRVSHLTPSFGFHRQLSCSRYGRLSNLDPSV